jgi:anti-sigma B factor antagonist
MNYYVTEAGATGDETTIVLGGDLDMCAAPAIRDALRRAVDAGSMHVIVDLANATFVDSTAIGALYEAATRLRESGGRLSLICTNRNVLRTIQIAGLERHLALQPTPELHV